MGLREECAGTFHAHTAAPLSHLSYGTVNTQLSSLTTGTSGCPRLAQLCPLWAQPEVPHIAGAQSRQLRNHPGEARLSHFSEAGQISQ